MSENKNEEWERLQAMVDAFAAEMKARLYQKMQQGYTGWDDPAQVPWLAERASQDALAVSNSIIIHDPVFDRYNPDVRLRYCVDAANLLAMVWHIWSKEGQ